MQACRCSAAPECSPKQQLATAAMTPAAATASAAQWTTTHPLTSPGGRCCLACRSGRRVKCTPAPDQSETGASAAMLRRTSTCCMMLSTCDGMAPPSASNGCAPPSLRLRPEVPFVQQVKPDNKPIGNSLNGRYSVPRPRAAGKSGSVNRSVASAGRAAKARKALAQPMRRSPATPRTSQRQAKSRAASSRCVCAGLERIGRSLQAGLLPATPWQSGAAWLQGLLGRRPC